MENSIGSAVPLFNLGDELLLGVMEFLSIPDILSCTLVNKRLQVVAQAATIPFRNALERYTLEYCPYNSKFQPTPDRPLFELVDLVNSLNRLWLRLETTSSLDISIIEALDDVYFFRDYVIIDRIDEPLSDDDEENVPWEIEVFKYGGLPTSSQDGGAILEVEEDGTIVEEIDPEAHGIDVNAIETEDEDEDVPENSDSEDNTDESDGALLMTTEGVHSIGVFHGNNSSMSAYRVDITQDLIITAERWQKSKQKKPNRRARGGLNFNKYTQFLRCLTVSELKPHPACQSHMGAININSLCTENKEDYHSPLALQIQGPLVAFATRAPLLDRITIINWHDPPKPITIQLRRDLYMDMHFISDDLLIVFTCPITSSDLARRSLDDEDFPIAPEEGKMRIHLYYIGPKQNGISSPCLLRTLLFPRFNNHWRADIDSGKIVPQTSDVSSRPRKDGPVISEGLPFRSRNESGVVCLTISGLLLRHSQGNDDDDDDDNDEDYSTGTGWVIDIVILKQYLLSLAQNALVPDDTERTKLGKELNWIEWIGHGGENVRLFPHSDEGWLGSPKVYEACSYRVASVTPLKRGEHGNEVFGNPDTVPEPEVRRKVIQADRRLDVLDFCPGRIDDVRQALEAKRRREELDESEKNDNEGMFGVIPSSMLEGDGCELTLVDTPSSVNGGPFAEDVQTALPYLISRFDLEKGRKADNSLPLPESVSLTETELVMQIESQDEESTLCPAFIRYSFLN
ncbi:hypothetical protein CPB86DRAFT_780497 [Serendipita vermifera]|nr:hypothetical protein CPB86DRAFT_780497 [Serendipita vermifera]